MAAVPPHVTMPVAQMLFVTLSIESQYVPVHPVSNQIQLQKMDVSVPSHLAAMMHSARVGHVWKANAGQCVETMKSVPRVRGVSETNAWCLVFHPHSALLDKSALSECVF